MPNRTGPITDSCSTPLLTGLQVEYNPLTDSFWAPSSNNSVLPSWLSTHLDCNIPPRVQGFFGSQFWKPYLRWDKWHLLSPLVHKSSHFTTEGNQVDQGWFTLGISPVCNVLLAFLSPLRILNCTSPWSLHPRLALIIVLPVRSFLFVKSWSSSASPLAGSPSISYIIPDTLQYSPGLFVSCHIALPAEVKEIKVCHKNRGLWSGDLPCRYSRNKDCSSAWYLVTIVSIYCSQRFQLFS